MSDPVTLQDLLVEFPRFGAHPAVGLRAMFGTRWWSYKQLHQRSLRVAQLLREYDLQPTDRVLIHAPACPEWAALLFGCTWRGLVPILVDTNTLAAELQRIATENNVRLLIFTAGQLVESMCCPMLRIASLEDTVAVTAEEAAALHIPVLLDDVAVMFVENGTATPVSAYTHRQLMQPTHGVHPSQPRVDCVLTPGALNSFTTLVSGLLQPLQLGRAALCTRSASPLHLQRVIESSSFGIQVVCSTDIPSMQESTTLEDILSDVDAPRKIERLARLIAQELPAPTQSTLRQRVRALAIDSMEQAELLMLVQASLEMRDDCSMETPCTVPPRSSALHRAPRWQSTSLGIYWRTVISAVFRRAVLPIALHGRVTGLHHLRSLRGPIFFVLRRSERQHPVEFLSILRAVPAVFARRIMVGVSDRPFFESHFYRRPGDSALYRFFVSGVALFGLPSVMPYVLLEAGLTHGMDEICEWAERGYCPLVTWTPAMARLATETNATVVPVRLQGRWSSWWNARVHVHFAAPRMILPFADPLYTHLDVEAGFRAAVFEEPPR